jgi:hypothetical protein
MIHLRLLPSLSSLNAWMHSGVTETLEGDEVSVAVGLESSSSSLAV